MLSIYRKRIKLRNFFLKEGDIRMFTETERKLRAHYLAATE